MCGTRTSLSERAFHKWITLGYIFVLCKGKTLLVGSYGKLAVFSAKGLERKLKMYQEIWWVLSGR
jgi:hypothetical protein